MIYWTPDNTCTVGFDDGNHLAMGYWLSEGSHERYDALVEFVIAVPLEMGGDLRIPLYWFKSKLSPQDRLNQWYQQNAFEIARLLLGG